MSYLWWGGWMQARVRRRNGWPTVSDEAEDREYKWEITPNPYNNDYDVFVTDGDDEACQALAYASENAWDQCEPGETKTLTIKHNRTALSETTDSPKPGSKDVILTCEKCGAKAALPAIGANKLMVDLQPANNWQLYPKCLCPKCDSVSEDGQC